MSDGLRWPERRKSRARPLVRRLRYGRAGMTVVATLVAALICAAPGVTHATATTAAAATPLPPLPPPPPRPTPGTAQASREKGRWYGWELIVSDTLFLILAGDGANQRPEFGLGSAGLTVGLLGIVVVPPALHFIHGNPRRAGFGLLVRGLTIGLWTAAFILPRGGGNSCNGQDGCVGIDIGADDVVLFGLAVAAVGGAITYAFIDDFWFSRVPEPPSSSPPATVVPMFYPRPGGGGLSLVGTF